MFFDENLKLPISTSNASSLFLFHFSFAILIHFVMIKWKTAVKETSTRNENK
jgi:hypothetical protein